MSKRMPAEWENPKRILLAYPGRHTDWAYILEDAKRQFDSLIRALVEGREFVCLIADPTDLNAEIKNLIEDNEGQIFFDIPYNDTWTRDYGPITIEKGEGKFRELDFGFNGWGLKFAADKDNLVNLKMALKSYRNKGYYRNHRDFILEGGSIESDGKDTILTTHRCLCSPNRNGGMSEKEIEIILCDRLGAKRVLWLHHGFLEGDDTDSHVDTLARMAPGNCIVYMTPPEDHNDNHFDSLSKMEEELRDFKTSTGEPYRLIPLPFPDPVFDEDGQRLPATYVNYLVTGWNLYMPIYNQPLNDAKAIESIGRAFPRHKIIPVDCSVLIRQHGSLHCSTMQLYI